MSKNLTAPRFKPGQSGNPGGKPVGARNKLTAKFLNTLAKDFEEHGEEAIERCRLEDVSTYVKVVAGLMPKQIEDVTDNHELDELTDAELIDIIRGRSAPEAQTGSDESTDLH